MNTENIINELNNIFEDILDLEKISLNEFTTADDIEEWDSLNNIQIIVAIEKHFQIKFLTSEIENFKNIGEMINSIYQKLN